MSTAALKGLLIILVLFGAFRAGVIGGYTFEHDRNAKLMADLNAKVAVQTALVKQQDHTIKENSDAAQAQLQDTASNITNYYLAHPAVRVLHSSSGCTVSQAAGDPQQSDGTAPVEYASPYTPESTEQVANRLKELQDLLLRDGVTVQ